MIGGIFPVQSQQIAELAMFFNFKDISFCVVFRIVWEW